MVGHDGTSSVYEISLGAEGIYPDKKRKQDELPANTVNEMYLEHPTIIWVPPTDGSDTGTNLPNYYRMSEAVFKKHGWILVVNSTYTENKQDRETLIQFWTTDNFEIYVRLADEKLYKVKNVDQIQ